MKKDSLRSQLSLTQQQMATLLGVNRSQYSMYESGKRDLPLRAIHTHTALVAHLQRPADAKVETKKEEKQFVLEHLQRLQRETEYKLAKLERKLVAIAKKQQAQATADLLARFTANNPIPDPKKSSGTQLVIAIAAGKVSAHKKAEWAALGIDKEVLEFKRSLLEAKVRAIKGGESEVK
jgi:transcriptional regulator with XRE-family HTH domain